MGLETREIPINYQLLATEAKEIVLAHETESPAMAAAKAVRCIAEKSPIELEPDCLFLGGENPFFFNLMRPARDADGFARAMACPRSQTTTALAAATAFWGGCFEGHITPGIDLILAKGISGIRCEIEIHSAENCQAPGANPEGETFHEAARLSCESVLRFAERCREEAIRQSRETDDPGWAGELVEAARILERVPERPARTLREALQSYWIIYALVTMEMGGATPGGGIGLGRLDQSLYPFYERDVREGRITREEGLELLELFLLNFRHVDFYTDHQPYTPGSQASVGGITISGEDASNDLTELILEASMRIAMPAPYISLRLHKNAPERYWQIAANYVLSGLGFPVVNDEVIIEAMLRHGRSLEDARDYICSCCYEHTIPGRDAFHPSAAIPNLPLILELALNEGRLLDSDQTIGAQTPSPQAMHSFEDVFASFEKQIHFVFNSLVGMVNGIDQNLMETRRNPLMSLFFEDCIPQGRDVLSGGARYNLTGCIGVGLPNVANSLAAINDLAFIRKAATVADIVNAMKENFEGHVQLRQRLIAAPKWGNDDPRVDSLAARVTDMLYDKLAPRRNPRGGRWQLALYSFAFNNVFGEATGATADGRKAREPLTRNLNPTPSTDHEGPTAVLKSLSAMDFTKAPDGAALDLRFDPALFQSNEGCRKFAGFLKAFVDLKVMEMQITMVDTETLLKAQENPAQYPDLLVKVAGYSARFVELPLNEQKEIIARTMHGA